MYNIYMIKKLDTFVQLTKKEKNIIFFFVIILKKKFYVNNKYFKFQLKDEIYLDDL